MSHFCSWLCRNWIVFPAIRMRPTLTHTPGGAQ
jgi:hypothetical protein